MSALDPSSRRTLLVGYGKLATRLVPLLLARGERVAALRRTEGALPDGVEGITADLAHPLPTSLERVDAVLVTLPPGETETFYRTALGHIARALPEPPARTVFVSSTGVFEGADPAHRLTEQDEPSPTTPRSRGLVDGERAAVELFDAVVVRPAGIYGPGRDYLVRKVLEGAAVDHSRRTNRIHESDLVRTLDLLLRLDAPPRVLHAVDQGPAPLGDVVRFLAARLDTEVPPDSGPAGPRGVVYDGALLLSLLGDLEHPTYESGYAQMVDTV